MLLAGVSFRECRYYFTVWIPILLRFKYIALSRRLYLVVDSVKCRFGSNSRRTLLGRRGRTQTVGEKFEHTPLPRHFVGTAFGKGQRLANGVEKCKGAAQTARRALLRSRLGKGWRR
jgi:hypothetical protein